MQECKFCGSTLPNNAHFCANCGHVIDELNQGTTKISNSPEFDMPTIKSNTPPLFSEPWLPRSFNASMGQSDLDVGTTLPWSGEVSIPDNQQFQERRTDENQVILPGMMLLAGQIAEGQVPAGNVPMVQGTPQVSGVPAVQGTPAVPAHPAGAQAFYHNAAPSAPTVPTPSWVPHKPGRRHIPRPHGIAQHLLVAAVAVVVIATTAATGALAIFRPALSLSVNGGITPGGTIQLHGQNFTPGSSVTLTLDQGVPLSSIGHGNVGVASYGSGFANVLQMSVAVEHSQQATTQNTSIPVSIQGTFNAMIQVDQNWSAGVHTIHATDRVLGRTADLQFAIPPAQAKLLVTPSSILDFGSLETGRKVVLPVIVGNIGGRQLHWTADVGSTPWLQIQPASGMLLPGNHEQVVNIVADASNLNAKNYSAILHITSDAGEARITAKLKVIPPGSGSSAKAILDVNPASLDFGTRTVPAQVNMNVTVANTGTQTLNWSADTGNASWLKLSSSSGKIQPGGLPQILSVTADTTQLAAGNHSAMLNIKSNGGNKQVAITVVVKGATPTPTPTPTGTTPTTSPAVLAVNPAGLDFGKMDPGTTKTLQETVSDSGGQSLTWNVDTGGTNWLSVDTGNGTVQPGGNQTINVKADTSNLSPGPYSATLNFTSNGGNKSVQVSLVVNTPIQPPKIAVSPNPLDFGALDPNATKTLPETVKNTGGQSLTWNLDTTSLPGWLSVDKSSDTVQANSSETINVTVNTANLKPGPYSVTLNFSSDGGNASISVTLTVNTPQPVQRTLTSQQTQSQTVKATGQGTTQGTQATGMLRVENHDTANPLNIKAGTMLPNQSNPAIQMRIDQDVSLLPAGYTDVPATVVEDGTIGNLPGPCCGSGPEFQNQCDSSTNCGPQIWDIFNSTPFTGGTDAQTYTVVQQSDIDNAANSLKASTNQSALADLKSQLQPNEHLVGNPQCTYNVTSDHAAGDQATTVAVTVVATCTATAST